MKQPLYIAIYALLITLCSTKGNSSSNKTPGKEVYYKLLSKIFEFLFLIELLAHRFDSFIKSIRHVS